MAETSDVFLVRGSLQLLEQTEMKDTTSLLFWTAAGGTANWTANADCHVVQVVNVGGSTQLCLSTDGTSYTTNFSAAGNNKFGSVIYLGGTTLGQNMIQNFPIRKNSKIYFVNNGASSGSALVFITYDA